MQEQLMTFAGGFDAIADHAVNGYDEGKRSVHHPLVLVFLGDKSLDALEAIQANIAGKWGNKRGVVYLHIYSRNTVPGDDRFGFQLSSPEQGYDRRTVRKQLHRQLWQGSEQLVNLNRVIRQAANRIAGFGSHYISVQQVDIAVVARADDPVNALTPEVALLLRTVLAESYKQIQMDLYALLQESQEDSDYAYSVSLSVSFLRELDEWQNRDYGFHAPLQVTEDGIRLPVEHRDAPLFDLVYLLGDKNEHGVFAKNSLKVNYDIIARICLLKNSKSMNDNQAYNNQSYRQHINSPHIQGKAYSSAGLSQVTRPNKAIALTVLDQLYQYMLEKLREAGKQERRSVLELWRMDGDFFDRIAAQMVSDDSQLQDMNALLSSSVSLGELKKLTLAEAEAQLYGEHAEQFFRQHFADPAYKQLEALDVKREVWQLAEAIIRKPGYGLYCAWIWSSETEDAAVFQELNSRIRDTSRQLEEGRQKLVRQLQESVNSQTFFRWCFFKSRMIKQYTRHYFNIVYGQKLQLLQLEIRLALLKRLEDAFVQVHKGISVRYEQLQELGRQIKEAGRRSITESDDYLGRNISEYYAGVVSRIVKEMEAKRGDRFLFDERFLGSLSGLLEHGTEQLLARLAEVCEREVFPRPDFHHPFEVELLERANVTIHYDDEQSRGILSKEELYRDLYNTLQEQSAVHIHVYHYTQKHRYSEQYFIGDCNSEFIGYASAVDQGSRSYKLGCFHERRTSGIEKLQLMGGFQMSDVMYYRNGIKYYDSYCANGFEFHDQEPGAPDHI